jgi:hypothetical protein
MSLPTGNTENSHMTFAERLFNRLKTLIIDNPLWNRNNYSNNDDYFKLRIICRNKECDKTIYQREFCDSKSCKVITSNSKFTTKDYVEATITDMFKIIFKELCQEGIKCELCIYNFYCRYIDKQIDDYTRIENIPGEQRDLLVDRIINLYTILPIYAKRELNSLLTTDADGKIIIKEDLNE